METLWLSIVILRHYTSLPEGKFYVIQSAMELLTCGIPWWRRAAPASMFPQQLHRLRRTAGAAQGLANLLWHDGSGGRQRSNSVDTIWYQIKIPNGHGVKCGGAIFDDVLDKCTMIHQTHRNKGLCAVANEVCQLQLGSSSQWKGKETTKANCQYVGHN